MEQRYKKCTVTECNGNAHRDAEGKLNYCNIHYQRHRRHGSPHTVLAVPSPAADWLAAHVSFEGDGCLKWPFAIGEDGYGRFHRPNGGSLTTASNAMCSAAYGAAPTSRHECAHSCGRGHDACVNPRHLYWATPQENQVERVRHKTSNRGVRQWQAKLKEADVRAIRLLLPKQTNQSIAEQFGLARATVWAIRTGKNWGWLV